MPKKETIEKAEEARKEGKAPSTQAGEFVREEIKHIRKGKHGARSTKQAIAIGLSKARRSGVELAPPAPGKTSKETRRKAERDLKDGQSKDVAQSKEDKAESRKRSHAASSALEREPRKAASRQALSRHAHGAAKKRSASSRSAAAKKAAETKGAAGRSAAARKAARTRAQANS